MIVINNRGRRVGVEVREGANKQKFKSRVGTIIRYSRVCPSMVMKSCGGVAIDLLPLPAYLISSSLIMSLKLLKI